MRKLKVVGFDPSMNNWGMAFGEYAPFDGSLELHDLRVIQPEKPSKKNVRTSSVDLIGGEQLASGVIDAIAGADAVFVEVPVGSQNAASMKGYGICIGILAMMRANGTPFFEITPTEVKLAGPGNKTASKRDMMQWAHDQHPNCPWPFQTKKGRRVIIESKAEHMADAVAAIYAGIALPEFQRLTKLLAAA